MQGLNKNRTILSGVDDQYEGEGSTLFFDNIKLSVCPENGQEASLEDSLENDKKYKQFQRKESKSIEPDLFFKRKADEKKQMSLPFSNRFKFKGEFKDITSDTKLVIKDGMQTTRYIQDTNSPTIDKSAVHELKTLMSHQKKHIVNARKFSNVNPYCKLGSEKDINVLYSKVSTEKDINDVTVFSIYLL